MFSVLADLDIILSLKKSFLDYPIVQFLGQKVDSFDLTIIKNKFTTITKLIFPKILKEFEIYLSLTD